MSEDKDSGPTSYRRRRSLLGLGVGALLFGAFLIIGFTPSVFGQSAPGNSAQDQAYFSTLQSVYRYILNNYVDKTDPQTLFDGAMRGMFESLKDPHTAYLDPSDFRSLTDITTGEFGGVGMYIDKQRDADGNELKDGLVEVVAPIEDTPAARAGLKPGDLIAQISGKTVVGVNIDDVLSMIRGTPGTSIELQILRGKTMDFKVTLTRENIELPTVKYAMIGSTAYVRLIEFTPRTNDRLKEALANLKKQNYKSIVLDLRNNGGGVLSGAIDVGNLFFSDGVIVSTRGRVASEDHVYNAQAGAQVVDSNVPLVVLINGGTASASEIVSGALKDRSRAAFVGTKSYGKGSVQTVRSLGDRGFRLTTARYYTPAGITIDKIGIKPDVEVPDPVFTKDEEYAFGKLRDLDLVTKFVDANAKPTDADIQAFEKDLPAKGVVLSDHIVRQLIHNEVIRRLPAAPVYDLDFDDVLNKALGLIADGKVQSIIDARPKVAPDAGSAALDAPASSVQGLPTPNAGK